MVALRIPKVDERVQMEPRHKLSMLELLHGNNEKKRGVCAVMMATAELTKVEVPTTGENILWWANLNAPRYEREMDLLLEENKVC